jgi:two-component system sensor histidine kinase TctE
MSASLRVRLLWWLLLPLAAFVIVSGVNSYANARRMADLVQDGALLSAARMIAGEVHWEEGKLLANAPPAALEIFASPYQDQVFFSVVTAAGQQLAGRPDLPLPASGAAAPVYYDTRIGGQPIHAVALERLMYDAGAVRRVTVAIGKTQASHEQMLLTLWRPQMLRQLAMLGLAIALVFLGLTFELRPLMRLKDEVAGRDPMALRPLRPERLHIELRPIVDAINQCIQRLNLHVAAQRRFIADAAHQLRTPLTLLETQLQFARQREPADSGLSEALAAMQKSNRAMTELTNKLLLLAQAEASAPPALLQSRVDLAALAASALEELAVLAQRRGIDLGIGAMAAHAEVNGNESLLLALVMNLVDNAVRYTPSGGTVTLAVRREAGAPHTHEADGDGSGNNGGASVVLSVADDGPGIPAEARTRVFERFYRVAPGAGPAAPGAAPASEGTGLGLAIVREIVQGHGGTVALGPGSNGRGLLVTVRLPAAAG